MLGGEGPLRRAGKARGVSRGSITRIDPRRARQGFEQKGVCKLL